VTKENCILRSFIIFSVTYFVTKSPDSSVGVALGYGLDDQGSRVRFQAGAGNFSLHHRVQNGSGAHPASYPMGGSFPGVKLSTHLHLVPRSKNEWSYTSTPHYAFMVWCSVKAQGQLYIYFYFVRAFKWWEMKFVAQVACRGDKKLYTIFIRNSQRKRPLRGPWCK
jgi:hypothetical protein